MNIQELGFNDWFRTQADSVLRPGQGVARVMAVDRGSYLVRGEAGESRAELSGKSHFEAGSAPDLPCVGDWVCVELASPELAIIQSVLPRKTSLRRKCPGKTVDFQMIAANLDVAFIVQSCHFDFNIRRLDRYLVVAREGGIDPFVILTKKDLVLDEDLEGMMCDLRGAGIAAPLLAVSNTTGEGLAEFRDLLAPGRTYGLLGSSGVGKTTLINRLLGNEVFATKTVSGTGEGVHTTSRRQLLVLENGAILVDTPGMRELGLLGAGDGLDDSFSDIRDLSRDCRFGDCAHEQEPGCAVRAAIESGELNEARYQSYLKLKKESDYHDMSYVQKRKKDKDFGRHVREVMKHKKR